MVLLYLINFGTWSLILLLLSAVGGTALSMAYGIEIKPINDPYIALAEIALKSIEKAASVGAFLVDIIPMLKYVPEFVPGAGFKKQARIWRKLQEDFRERPYLASIEAMVSFVFHLSLYTVFKLLFRAPACLDLHSHLWLYGMPRKLPILITNER